MGKTSASLSCGERFSLCGSFLRFFPVAAVTYVSDFSTTLFTLFNKWYFDEVYDFLFVKPAIRFGNDLWQRCDKAIIDRFGPNGVSALVFQASKICSRFQTGFVFHYAFAMLVGVVLFITWYHIRIQGLSND